MTDPQIRYDKPSDTLHIAFEPGEGAMGIELSDDILLRVNAPERRVVGLTLFNYSVLAQQTELGPRSFPLTGLSELGPELRSLVLTLVQAAPVSDFLVLSAYTPGPDETIPITSLRSERIVLQAA